MKNKIAIGMLAIAMILTSSADGNGQDKKDQALIQAAESLFKKYVEMGEAFEPAVADLYSDDARIQNTRRYPNGEARTMTMPAAQYKEMIRKVMPVAKVRGDTNTYTNTRFNVEGEGVRIQSTRHSNLKNYDSPLSLLVAPNKDGIWLIKEELSESRP